MREVPVSVLSSIPQSHIQYDTNNSKYDDSTTDSKTGANSTTEADSTLHRLPHENINPVEFFISSDGSAILEHTNRVIYLEVIYFYTTKI